MSSSPVSLLSGILPRSASALISQVPATIPRVLGTAAPKGFNPGQLPQDNVTSQLGQALTNGKNPALNSASKPTQGNSASLSTLSPGAQGINQALLATTNSAAIAQNKTNAASIYSQGVSVNTLASFARSSREVLQSRTTPTTSPAPAPDALRSLGAASPKGEKLPPTLASQVSEAPRLEPEQALRQNLPLEQTRLECAPGNEMSLLAHTGQQVPSSAMHSENQIYNKLALALAPTQAVQTTDPNGETRELKRDRGGHPEEEDDEFELTPVEHEIPFSGSNTENSLNLLAPRQDWAGVLVNAWQRIMKFFF